MTNEQDATNHIKAKVLSPGKRKSGEVDNRNKRGEYIFERNDMQTEMDRYRNKENYMQSREKTRKLNDMKDDN